MTYTPKIDDYVIWKDTLGRVTEGWVYFFSEHYITIEVGVKDKPKCEYTRNCLLYTSPSPRDQRGSRMPSSA